MRARKAAAATTLAGLALMLAMAWPVAFSPDTHIYGNEIDGRHHDPYTVMWQFEHGPPPPPYRQPLVDDAGAWLSRALGPVAAFNVVVLLTFPLSVLTAFALARYLRLSNAGAAVAAVAFAFAPPHLAHAAYHPHIAQTQWIPSYFLALWACADRPSPARLALLLAAAAALALSNLYNAFIAAVLTPVALAAWWATTQQERRTRQAATSLGMLAAAGGIALAIMVASAPEVFGGAPRFAFQRADLARYGAQWFAYLVPPVDHPFWGGPAARVWAQQGMTGAVLEQQITISVALLALAAVALWHWMRSRPAVPAELPAALRIVPMLAIVALAAAFCSLAPAPGSSGASLLVPATWLHALAPMFRAYARFAFVTHLMVALLAGIGFSALWRGAPAASSATRVGRAVAVVLLAAAAIEYAPLPPRARDVLPTAAHRWVAGRTPPVRVLDCVEPSQADALVPWLMQQDVTTLSAEMPSCVEPNIGQQAATRGFAYLIVRRPLADWPTEAPRGLVLARTFTDGDVYNVVADTAPAALVDMRGFSRTEVNDSGSWRWMGQRGTWLIRNVRGSPVAVALELELSALDVARRVAVAFDGGEPQIIEVAPEGSMHRLGPWTLGAGTHQLTFIALEPAAAAPAPDPRQLTVMFRDWRWRVE